MRDIGHPDFLGLEVQHALHDPIAVGAQRDDALSCGDPRRDHGLERDFERRARELVTVLVAQHRCPLSGLIDELGLRPGAPARAARRNRELDVTHALCLRALSWSSKVTRTFCA